MSFEGRADVFTAHLYINGYPLVLNQQYLQTKLLNKRLTAEQRVEFEAGLADKVFPRFVTLADYDDDAPLLFQFVSVGEKKYEVYAKLPGKYDGWRLAIDQQGRHLEVTDEAALSTFSLIREGAERALYKDFGPGPSQVILVSEERQSGMYLARSNYRDKHGSTLKNDYRNIIVDVNPNFTGHDAFNGRVAKFLLKVVDEPQVTDF